MDRRRFLESGLAAAAALALTPRLAPARTRAPVRRILSGPIVETAYGKIRGTTADGLHAFRGVPYGASTTGAKRFAPPRPPVAWTQVRDTIDLGPCAPQVVRTHVAEWASMDRPEPQSEDCLVLNVWTPALADGRRRPVMVWLHGDGFDAGSAGSAAYDGANLARAHDMVVVGVNHRLNLFGFLYLGELLDDAEDGNAGMFDIVAALEWVRAHAERFGGDPANVTLAGHSGGASKVSVLLGMPAAKGLFHRAVMMSGARVTGMPRLRAAETTERVLALLKIRRDEAVRLRDVPMPRLRELLDLPGLSFGPVVDGHALPDTPLELVASSGAADVPLMIGSTETEQTWIEYQENDPLTTPQLRARVMRLLETDVDGANEALAVYKTNRPMASNRDLLVILASDASAIRAGTDRQADCQADNGDAPVYKYYFQWYSPVRDGQLRAMHAMDVPFALRNHGAAASMVGAGPDLAVMADRWSGALAAFARTGNPNHELIPAWPAYETGARATMVMNTTWRVAADPFGAEKRVIARVTGRRPESAG